MADAPPSVQLAVVWLTCEVCGLNWPAEPNVSPGVPRETRCQRCCYALYAKAERSLASLQAERDTLKAENERLKNELRSSERLRDEMAFFFVAVNRAIAGEPVSDFEESNGHVLAALDLRFERDEARSQLCTAEQRRDRLQTGLVEVIEACGQGDLKSNIAAVAQKALDAED